MRRLVFVSAFVMILGLSLVAWTVHAEPKALAGPLAVLVSPQAAPSVQAVELRVIWPLTQLQMPSRQANESALTGWIDKEVPDIATREEREAFLRLATEEERARFVEMFWLRRDPTPSTDRNEFRDEYYRRIAVANQLYAKTGVSGWLTDRGRVMVMHGEADEKETHAGFTDRNPGPPIEQWLYRYIEGIGANVILTFVDGLATPTARWESPKDSVAPGTVVSPPR